MVIVARVRGVAWSSVWAALTEMVGEGCDEDVVEAGREASVVLGCVVDADLNGVVSDVG
ncbi:hypothetical protein [Curtobacterium sp. MCBA15_001]|uniref:hypothetical protein n=1 Tax=Curtobacterium sp. MCBA15_001 TaxID=1898731 RepID=UPI0015876F28|nr:hypothetical protein [Curtobacterium sp. MCBA15_001]